MNRCHQKGDDGKKFTFWCAQNFTESFYNELTESNVSDGVVAQHMKGLLYRDSNFSAS